MIKILFVGAANLADVYFPATEREAGAPYTITALPEDASVEDMIASGQGAEVLVISPMSTAPEALMEALPNLRLIQSAGVGFQGINLTAASKKSIPDCIGDAHL